MTAIREDRQELSLDRTWQAVKWDEAAEFKGSMEVTFHALPPGRSVKAADVVAVRRRRGASPLLLIAEFKDFNRPNLPPNIRTTLAEQALTSELMRNVLAKVIDSLAGAAFAHDKSGTRSPELQAWHAAIGVRTVSLLVLICVEVPPSQAPTVLAWTTELKRRLRWLGSKSHVLVTSSLTPMSGTGITYKVI